MTTNASRTVRYERSYTGPVVALGFFIIGFFSLCAALGILQVHPEITLGDPFRVEFLGFGALVGLGFVGSFVFGAGYVVSPVMANGSLYSHRCALLHLLLHGLGLGWLVVVFGGMNFLAAPRLGLFIGIGIVLLGGLFYIINVLATASRFNRWEPEQITFVAALFWLGLTGLLGAGVLLNTWIPFLKYEPGLLLESHAPLGLVGFLWLSLLGFSLKLFNMFLVSEKTAGTLSWLGWILVNLALLAMVPLLMFGGQLYLGIAIGMLFGGSLCYLADIVRLWIAAKRPVDWALTGAFFGLLTGLGLFVWAVLGMPFSVSGGELQGGDSGRALFVVGVFGTFSITILALSIHLIPFLVWQIRCAPLVGRFPVPTPKELDHPGAAVGAVVCLGTAWLYLAVGQWQGSAAGAQLAGLCLLIGLFWFVWSLLPALKALVYGIRIEDPDTVSRKIQ